MKKVLLSLSIIIVGSIMIAFTSMNDVQTLLDSTSTTNLAIVQAQAPVLKLQQAHLRTIDPFDIDIIPTSKPVPEKVRTSSPFGMRMHPILNVEKMHLGIKD